MARPVQSAHSRHIGSRDHGTSPYLPVSLFEVRDSRRLGPQIKDTPYQRDSSGYRSNNFSGAPLPIILSVPFLYLTGPMRSKAKRRRPKPETSSAHELLTCAWLIVVGHGTADLFGNTTGGWETEKTLPKPFPFPHSIATPFPCHKGWYTVSIKFKGRGAGNNATPALLHSSNQMHFLQIKSCTEKHNRLSK